MPVYDVYVAFQDSFRMPGEKLQTRSPIIVSPVHAESAEDAAMQWCHDAPPDRALGIAASSPALIVVVSNGSAFVADRVAIEKLQDAAVRARTERVERAEYERLKAKYGHE